MKDIPKLSHLRFDALVSFASIQLQKPDFDGGFMSWGNVFSNSTYIVLPENSSLETLQANLDKLCLSENKQLKNQQIQLSTQSLNSITIGNRLENTPGPVSYTHLDVYKRQLQNRSGANTLRCVLCHRPVQYLWGEQRRQILD